MFLKIVKIKQMFFPFFIAVYFFSCLSLAQSLEESWNTLNSKHLKIFPAHDKRSTSTPKVIQWFFKIISWEPKGMSQSPSCEKLAQEWSDFASLDLYFEACEEKISDHSILSQLFGLRTLSIANDLTQNSLVRRVQFQLDSGVLVTGVLGIKDFVKKRPLVILRLGIFGQSDEMLAETFIYKMLFEQSHFNILVLDNSSNIYFLKNNPNSLSFAGYDEGSQNLAIAYLLKNNKQEPLSQLVSTVHLTGVSLGGHGVIYANIKNKEQQSPIDSFMAFCPLIQFNETLEYHRGQTRLLNRFANYWGRLRLEDFLKDKAETFVSSNQILPDLADYIAHEYGKNHEDKKIFFKQNDFLKNNDFSSEMLIFSSVQDTLVPYDLNARWLMNQQKEGLFTKAIVQPLKYSFHCAVPDHYLWAPWSNLLNSYIEQKSPELKFQKHTVKTKIANLHSSDFGQLRKSISWDRKTRRFEVFIQFFNQSRPFDLKFYLKPEDLDFYFDAQNATDSEVQMAQRWLYRNIQFSIESTRDEKNYLGVLQIKHLY